VGDFERTRRHDGRVGLHFERRAEELTARHASCIYYYVCAFISFIIPRCIGTCYKRSDFSFSLAEWMHI